jgi:hypothetical protein
MRIADLDTVDTLQRNNQLHRTNFLLLYRTRLLPRPRNGRRHQSQRHPNLGQTDHSS